MVYKFFDKKSSGRVRKLEKRKVHSCFIDNIWCADLADMELISKFHERTRFLLCVIGIYSKYA